MRVVIVEDNVLLAEGLTLMLERARLEVVAVATDAAGFQEALDEHHPDVTIVDVRLPPSYRDEGIHAAIAARRAYPGLPVLVLSQYVELVYAVELLSDEGGGIGYLLKDRVSRVEEFIEALLRVAAGGTALDAEVVAQLLTRSRNNPLAALSPREQDVLALMAEGHDNTTICERLHIVNSSVHKHIGNIFAKLGLAPGDTGHRRVRAVLTYLQTYR